jgi:spore coat protein U-like protein
MRLSKLSLPGLTAAAALVLAPLVGQAAGSDTGTLSVTATVDHACTIGDATLAFGAYNPVAVTELTNTTTIAVQCTNRTSYNITLNGGGSGVTSGNVRTMRLTPAGTTPGLTYELFSDSGLAAPLGVGVQLAGTGTGAVQNVPIYGRIAANQYVAIGSYSDSVIATINF